MVFDAFNSRSPTLYDRDVTYCIVKKCCHEVDTYDASLVSTHIYYHRIAGKGGTYNDDCSAKASSIVCVVYFCVWHAHATQTPV